jgi:uncharacterized repeat protein (TIGR02543 family)
MFGLKRVKFVLAAAALVAALPVVVPADETKTSNGTWTYNGYDYELWSENNAGTTSMVLNGDNGSGANAKGGTFSATWRSTINILFRAGRKFATTSGGTINGREPPKPALDYGNISINFAATWSSSDNVKMLGVYGWAFYAQSSIPTKDENGQNKSFAKDIEYYIIQDRGSYNAATGGDTKSTLKGTATIDGIEYEFRVCDRIGRNSISGSSVNFKQYFSVPKNTSSHRTSGTISVSKHFTEWKRVGMLMDGPLYEVALKVESYTGSGGNANGSATITKNILTVGGTATSGFSLTTVASPASGGTITRSPNSDSYASGASVTVTATAKSGYKFDGWSGGATGTTNPLTVTMNADKVITAKFSLTADDTTNLIKDGKFPGSSLTSNWELKQGQYYGNSEASASVSGGKATINVTKKGANPWEPQLVQTGIPIDSGVSYRLTFDAQASVARELQVLIQRPDSPYTTYAEKVVNLTTASQAVTLEFKMTSASNTNAQLAFNMGQSTGSVILSNVKLIRIANLGNSTGIASDRRLTSPSVKPTLRASQSASGVKVSFKASETGTATLRLYNIKGDVLSTAGLQTVSGKSYTQTLNPSAGKLPGGFYIVGLQRNGGAVERMAVLVH